MSKQLRSTFFSIIVAVVLVAGGFVGGTVLFAGFADENETRERPFFVEDIVNDATSQPVRFDERVNQSDVPTFSGVQQQGSDPVVISEIEQTMIGVYEMVSPSVVSINIEGTNTSLNGFQEEFGSSGSGFVIDQQGHIVTNFHVVDGADEIIVNFLDGTIVRAEVTGLDPDSDIAVIRVDLPAERLKPVTFGSEKTLSIGQAVLAIGSPFQQRWTMTRGIVSALDRDIRGLGQYSVGSVIQTDASINPGNSGGPLLNMAGEVIGVNSQILSETRSNSGIGFAVPATLTQRVAAELIENGRVDYSFIGITGGEINIDVIEQFGLANNQRGLPISGVVQGSPASDAGLRPPTQDTVDIITAIDGTPIISFSALIGYLAEQTRPGDTVTVTVLRDGGLIDLPLTLGDRPN